MALWKKCNGCQKKFDGAIHKDCPRCTPVPDLRDLGNTLIEHKDRIVFIDGDRTVMEIDRITNCVQDGALLVHVKPVKK